MVDKYSLKKEYIERIISKKELNYGEMLRIVYYYVNDVAYGTIHSMEEIEKRHFMFRNENYKTYQTFKAIRYFRQKYRHQPIVNIETVDKTTLKINDIVYDKENFPHVWDGTGFQKIKFFE